MNFGFPISILAFSNRFPSLLGFPSSPATTFSFVGHVRSTLKLWVFSTKNISLTPLGSRSPPFPCLPRAKSLPDTATKRRGFPSGSPRSSFFGTARVESPPFPSNKPSCWVERSFGSFADRFGTLFSQDGLPFCSPDGKRVRVCVVSSARLFSFLGNEEVTK